MAALLHVPCGWIRLEMLGVACLGPFGALAAFGPAPWVLGSVGPSPRGWGVHLP